MLIIFLFSHPKNAGLDDQRPEASNRRPRHVQGPQPAGRARHHAAAASVSSSVVVVIEERRTFRQRRRRRRLFVESPRTKAEFRCQASRRFLPSLQLIISFCFCFCFEPKIFFIYRWCTNLVCYKINLAKKDHYFNQSNWIHC